MSALSGPTVSSSLVAAQWDTQQLGRGGGGGVRGCQTLFGQRRQHTSGQAFWLQVAVPG